MSKRRRPALRSLSGTRSASVPLASRQVRFQVRCESDPRSDFWTPMESIGLLGSETPETGEPRIPQEPDPRYELPKGVSPLDAKTLCGLS